MIMTAYHLFLLVALTLFVIAALVAAGCIVWSAAWLMPGGAAAICAALLVRWYDHR
jgi:hypothetical protein